MIIKYVGENVIKHSGGGNPYHDPENGRFTFGPHHYVDGATAYRRYDTGDIKNNYKSIPPEYYTFKRNNKYSYTKQVGDEEPTVEYTTAGQKRKEYEESVNNSKSRKNRLEDEALYDTERWIRDDYKNFSDAAKGISEAAKGTSNMIDMFNVPKKNGRIDLSAMTDAELNNILNRERMERQYNDYFNAAQKNKGADYAKKFFDFVSWSGQQAMTAAQIISVIRSFA